MAVAGVAEEVLGIAVVDVVEPGFDVVDEADRVVDVWPEEAADDPVELDV